MDNFKDFWSGLSGKQQIATVIVSIIILYFVINYVKERKQIFDRVTNNKTEEQVLNSLGISPTHPQAFYTQQAKKIEVAISGWGTDEDAVVDAFKDMNNDADLVQLEKAFGIREEEDLSGWLYGDLSQYWIDLINQQLTLNGCTKQY